MLCVQNSYPLVIHTVSLMKSLFLQCVHVPFRYYTCNFQDKVQLYMVLDGHDGVRACEFVQKHLPNVLLRCDLGSGGEAVKEALMVAFRNTEREFFKRIDPHIARKITLQIEISVSIHITVCLFT